MLLLGGVAFLVFTSVRNVYQKANLTRNANHMRMIGLSLMNYHDSYNAFPLQAKYSPTGKPLLSWRVAILPYIGEDRLYAQFQQNEPWDSPHNKRLLAQMPRVYTTSGRSDLAQGMTQYQAFVGAHTVIANTPQQRVAMRDVGHGAANTIMIGLADTAVPWTKPADIPFEPGGPAPRLDSTVADGFLVLFVDQEVKIFKPETPPEILEALISRDGNFIGPVDQWIKRRP
jgi:hypothetical protein